ncbi:MAG TPA: hypothetical protein VLA24_07620, partial [Pseudomonadales bacterium]|nr:hypothetical protein [Pseudomonadales bacterium]
DGSGQANASQSTTFTLNLLNSNDIGTVSDRNRSVDEDGTVVFATGDFVYTDGDTHASNNTSAGAGKTLQSIRIVDVPGKGALWLDTNGNGTFDDSEKVQANQVIAYADLNKLRYTPNQDWASNSNADITDDSDDTFTWVGNDGFNDSSNVATTKIEVNLLNDAPLLTFSTGNTLTVRPNTGDPLSPVVVDAGLTIVDPESPYTTNAAFDTIKSVVVTVTDATNSAFVANDVLAIDTTGTSITAVYSTATGVLTLTGDASAADYQKVLRTMTFVNATSGNDNDHPRDINITMHTADVGTKTSAEFDGVNNFIDTGEPLLPMLGDYTISIWAKPDIADMQAGNQWT